MIAPTVAIDAVPDAAAPRADGNCCRGQPDVATNTIAAGPPVTVPSLGPAP